MKHNYKLLFWITVVAVLVGIGLTDVFIGLSNSVGKMYDAVIYYCYKK